MSNFSFSFSPLLPLWLIIAIACLVGALVAFGLFRRIRGSLIRAIAGVLLVLALLNPSALREEREPLKSVVALVVDKSASQKLDDRDSETEAAKQKLLSEFAKLKQFDVREVIAEDFVAQSTDVSTALFRSAKLALQDVPADRVGGVVMLTDGQVHDVPDSIANLGFDAPVHALITGKENEKDRTITITNLPKFGVVHEDHEIFYRVDEFGYSPPAQFLNVTISIDGNVVSTESAVPGEETSFIFEIPHGGKNIIELHVEEDAEEITTVNNRTYANVNGIRENLRVLLVSGEPHSGERTWRNLLKADTSVDLVHFTILRPPEKQDGTPISQLSLIAFPTRELFVEKIDEFDLIIFDRYRRRGVLPLLYFDNIARYVENGGAVLIASGPEYAAPDSVSLTPLQRVLPAKSNGKINTGPFRPLLSDIGKKHPVTRNLPGSNDKIPNWSRWFRSIGAANVSGEVVMRDEEKNPLLVLKRVGEGRVALLLSDHAWLWARNFEGGGPYLPLLRRTAHWLMKEPELDEERLSATSVNKEITITRQTLGESSSPVELTGPDGKTQELQLVEEENGKWSKKVSVDDIGLYEAKSGDLSVLAQVGAANPREYKQVVSTTQKIAPIAKETGGLVQRIADSSLPRLIAVNPRSATSGTGWIGLRDNQATRLVGIDRVPLFSGLLGLALLLFAFVGMWLREGQR